MTYSQDTLDLMFDTLIKHLDAIGYANPNVEKVALPGLHIPSTPRGHHGDILFFTDRPFTPGLNLVAVPTLTCPSAFSLEQLGYFSNKVKVLRLNVDFTKTPRARESVIGPIVTCQNKTIACIRIDVREKENDLAERVQARLEELKAERRAEQAERAAQKAARGRFFSSLRGMLGRGAH